MRTSGTSEVAGTAGIVRVNGLSKYAIGKIVWQFCEADHTRIHHEDTKNTKIHEGISPPRRQDAKSSHDQPPLKFKLRNV